MTITEWCGIKKISRAAIYKWIHLHRKNNKILPSYWMPTIPKGLVMLWDTYATEAMKKLVAQRIAESPPLPIFVEEVPASAEVKASLNSEVKRLRGENRNLLKELGNHQRFEDAALRTTMPLPPPPHVVPVTWKDLPEVDLVLCLGDWHIGDFISGESVERLNAYDFSIAVARMQYLVASLQRWVKGQRACYQINTCHVFVLGDMVSGGIHLELLTDEEFPPPKQCASAARLLATTLTDLRCFFSSVQTTFLSADNHSRTTLKPRHKRKVEFSLGHVVAAITRATLSEDLRQEFSEPPAPHTIVRVQDIRFLLQHGDYIRSYGITPDAAIEKAVMEEQVVRVDTEGFDVMVIGHFHRPSFKPHLVTNGALCGRTEYEHSKRFRMTHPTQVSFLVHPEHGMFNFTPWNLSGIPQSK